MSGYEVVLPQVDCSSADEFLDAISPLGPYFRTAALTDPWLFRGQSGDYPLVPSAYRVEPWKSLTKRNVEDPRERRLAEREILIRFFNIADRRGLLLPDDSQALRERLDHFNSQKGKQNPEISWEQWSIDGMSGSLMALAQHYGLPTPLLDWSRQPMVAAFFAADEAARRATHEGFDTHIVVWAFHYPILGKQDSIGLRTTFLRIVTAPSATNPNLRAQQGVFTLFQPQRAGKNCPANRPMEQALAELAAEADPEQSNLDKIIVDCLLRKFTLQASHAARLLYLLAKLDVTPSAIYPGYASIVNDLRQENMFSCI